MITQANLCLSIQRALLGVVPAELRAVTCGWSQDQIALRFIFDGLIDPDDEENMRIVGTEVAADFHEPTRVDEEIVRVDFPAKLIDYILQVWVYMRKEVRPANSLH